MTYCIFFFFFKQKTAYEMLRSLVGSEMCIRDSFSQAAEASAALGESEIPEPLWKSLDPPPTLRKEWLKIVDMIPPLLSYVTHQLPEIDLEAECACGPHARMALEEFALRLQAFREKTVDDPDCDYRAEYEQPDESFEGFYTE
eukprot:TRINITY_DN8861_c0_g1_i3.p2 TRINITY_DN8861_c0_g1~~TRINITY_DN8861_c0_g1_i3.p2  ORF type:complete len:143 (+),score=52.58 TRINITY_DN8861_c0_g1_i3:113-541(+)